MKVFVFLIVNLYLCISSVYGQRIKRIDVYGYNPLGGRVYPYSLTFEEAKKTVIDEAKYDRFQLDKGAKHIALKRKSSIKRFEKYFNYNLNECSGLKIDRPCSATIFIVFKCSDNSTYVLGLDNITSQFISDSKGRTFKCNDELYQLIIETLRFSEGRFKDRKIKTANECGC